MNCEYINNRINAEICHNTINKLSDQTLNPDFIISKSVVKKIQDIKNMLINQVQNIELVINQLLPYIIPASTKSSIRGLKFNMIVKQYIEGLNLDMNRFDIMFETKCDDCPETPDWIIIDKIHNTKIIGMNQVDLWRGGHQFNRGFNYLDPVKITFNSKYVCVVYTIL